MKLYNTETRALEKIIPMSGDTVRMYTCGPTIYNFAHIGNFRTYIVEDLLRRTIQFCGMKIEQAMNLTDIDDKTVGGALQKGILLKEFTEPFRIAFFEDLKTLNIQPAEHYPAATDFIPHMLKMIETLIEKDLAYVSNGSVYYSIKKFQSYGRLSHLCFDELQVNASGDNNADEYEKEDLSDFVLWKSYDPCRDGKTYWESPYGKGRPGWHIECSAMATHLLGESIDIHCGGVDNMFPHHENEIAQSEGCSGKRFVQHWMHVQHLLVNHRKMSKSLGNFYTLRDLLEKGYSGKEVRYLLLSTHYRTQLNFTLESLGAARAALSRIQDLIWRLQKIDESSPTTPLIPSILEMSEKKFLEALENDLNISIALSVMFDLIRELNAACDQKNVSKEDAMMALLLFEKWDTVLGVLPLKTKPEIPKEVEILIEKREEARKKKDFILSDQIRDEILAKGFLIEDTPKGMRVKQQ